MIWGRMPAAARWRTARHDASNEPCTPRTASWVSASFPSMLTETKFLGIFDISEAISGVQRTPLVSIDKPQLFPPDDFQQPEDVADAETVLRR